MEDRKAASSSSAAVSPFCPSSMSVDLLGGNEFPTPGIFSSVFPPASKIVGKNSSRFDSLGTWKKQAPEPKVLNAEHKPSDGIEEGCENENQNVLDKDKTSVNPRETVEPCIFGSSLHYGGQDIFSHSSTESLVTPAIADGNEDPNANNDNSASRGNWWQGSLYY